MIEKQNYIPKQGTMTAVCHSNNDRWDNTIPQLEIGKTYNVDYVIIGCSWSKVCLSEFPEQFFCFKHLNLSGKITNHSLQREERLEIPYKALREAIINSLCHRQWERYNLLNSIAIYDDRVEIGNPGIFPSQITPENIKEPHDSYPYNVKMAEVLYRSMWLENWGSGAKRIIEACQEQGVEEPTWRWDGAFVYVTFKRPAKHDSSINQVPTKQDDEPLNHRSTINKWSDSEFIRNE